MNLIRKIILCLLLVTMTGCFTTSYEGYGFFNNTQLYDYLEEISHVQEVDIGEVISSYHTIDIKEVNGHYVDLSSIPVIIIEKDNIKRWCVASDDDWEQAREDGIYDALRALYVFNSKEEFDEYRQQIIEQNSAQYESA